MNPTLLGMDTEIKSRTPFGERLLLARKHAKLTQKELAKRAGMQQGGVATLEVSGKGSLKTAVLAKVCGVRAEWLTDGTGPMLPADIPDPANTLASERVAHHLIGTPAAQDYRTIVLSLAEALEESAMEISVQQFVKLVEATYRKMAPSGRAS